MEESKSEFYIYGIIPYDKVNGNYSLILKEKEGQERMVALIIGSPEAQSIAIFLESLEIGRPLTHDLICNLLFEKSLDIDAVVIDDGNESTYYASILFSDGLILDSRPSDAISIAIRMGAPILITEEIVEKMHFNYNGVNGMPEEEREKDPPKNTRKKKGATKKEIDYKTLEKELNDAIEREDYERAAEIRDILAKN